MTHQDPIRTMLETARANGVPVHATTTVAALRRSLARRGLEVPPAWMVAGNETSLVVDLLR